MNSTKISTQYFNKIFDTQELLLGQNMPNLASSLNKLDNPLIIKNITKSPSITKNKQENISQHSDQSNLNGSSYSKYISLSKFKSKDSVYHLPISTEKSENGISVDSTSEYNKRNSIKNIEEYNDKLSDISKRILFGQEKFSMSKNTKMEDSSKKDKLGILSQKENDSKLLHSKLSEDNIPVKLEAYSHKKFDTRINSFESFIFPEDQHSMHKNLTIPEPKHYLQFNSPKSISKNDYTAKNISNYSCTNEPYIDSKIKEFNQTSKNGFQSLNPKIPLRENENKAKNSIPNNKRVNNIVRSLDKLPALRTPRKQDNINQSNQGAISNNSLQIKPEFFNCKKALFNFREESFHSTSPIKTDILEKLFIKLNRKKEEIAEEYKRNNPKTNDNDESNKTFIANENMKSHLDLKNIAKSNSKVNNVYFYSNRNYLLNKPNLQKDDEIHNLLGKK